MTLLSLPNSGVGQGAPGPGVVTIGVPGTSANTPPIPPRGNHHVSTTYITQDSVIIRGISGTGHVATTGNRSEINETMVKTSSKILQGKTDRMSQLQPRVQGDSNKERTFTTLEKGARQEVQMNPEITINFPEDKESVSPINISISSQKANDSEVQKLRDILLKDTTVEAS